MDKTKDKSVSIRFPFALLERIRKSAERHRRSINQEVLWLLEQSLERQKREKTDGPQEL